MISSRYGYTVGMNDDVEVPYALEQLDTGLWLGYAHPSPDVTVWGRGATREAAIADIREKCLQALTGVQKNSVPDSPNE